MLAQWESKRPFVSIRRENDGRRSLLSDDLFVVEWSSLTSDDVWCNNEQSVREWWMFGTSSYLAGIWKRKSQIWLLNKR